MWRIKQTLVYLINERRTSMKDTIGSRLKHAWNAFQDKQEHYRYVGYATTSRPDRVKMRVSNGRSIIASVYNRIAIDVSMLSVKHVRTDQNGRYLETLYTSLNDCLTLAPNLDQIASAFFRDVILSMFDEGCVAIVPVDTTIDPALSGSYEINSLRVGRIIEWFPNMVRIELYNELTGLKEEILMHKKHVAIIENPLFSVMNEPNSTLQRLIRKLNILDAIDEQSGSGKLDIIIQLPYVIKTEAKRIQAEERRRALEEQLSGSKYGIAYTDGTERVTQLNRPADNNLMTQVTYLTSTLFSQLGMTESIFDGTADEKTMLNYYNRTVEPCISAIVDGMKRSFLTKTARTQNQSIMYFRDPFKLVPISQLADIADKFTRNAILSSNDMRAIISYQPSDDPQADELSNKNLNQPTSNQLTEGEIQNGNED